MAKFGELCVAWLETFVAVAETDPTRRKLTASAHELGVSQSTVTRRLQNLQDSLGKVLFDRSVPPKLLPDGEKLLPVAREVLRLLEAAKAGLPPPVPKPDPVSPRDLKVPGA